jgi:hypothetical protein
MQGNAARIGVRIAVADEQERPASVAFDLELLAEAHLPLGEHAHERPRKSEVTRPLAVRRAPAQVHAPDRLGVEADTGVEAEAAPVDPAERDAPPTACEHRLGDLAGRRIGVTREAERTGEDARPAARDEPEGNRAVGTVQRLVVAAVTRVDRDRVVVACVGRELDRVARAAGQDRLDRPCRTQRVRDVREPPTRDPACERVDDQEHTCHAAMVRARRGAGRHPSSRPISQRFVVPGSTKSIAGVPSSG